jgi:hypothetical protein
MVLDIDDLVVQSRQLSHRLDEDPGTAKGREAPSCRWRLEREGDCRHGERRQSAQCPHTDPVPTIDAVDPASGAEGATYNTSGKRSMVADKVDRRRERERTWWGGRRGGGLGFVGSAVFLFFLHGGGKYDRHAVQILSYRALLFSFQLPALVPHKTNLTT